METISYKNIYIRQGNLYTLIIQQHETRIYIMKKIIIQVDTISIHNHKQIFKAVLLLTKANEIYMTFSQVGFV